MEKTLLSQLIREKKSMLCVGLDSDWDRLPKSVLKDPDPQYLFNQKIIHHTHDYAVAYKLNTAFYESRGVSGWISLQKTLEAIPPRLFTIADAKRGDIGNTSKQYAKAFFETMNFDAITVSPYMGHDSVKPFMEFEHKWIVILALTSNKGSYDFQLQSLEQGKKLYEEILTTASKWGSDQNVMFVVGATHPAILSKIRRMVPDHFLLVPGVGAQGGDLDTIMQEARNKEGGLLINASRSIIFADGSEDFARVAGERAEQLQQAMLPYFMKK